MTNQQDRRERIAAQVLAAIYAAGNTGPDWYAKDAETAVGAADALIAVLDRTAKPSKPEQPEGWIVSDDERSIYPLRDDSGQWFRPVKPWADFASAQEVAFSLGCRVRKWPLDPAEDKEVQS